MSTVSAKADEPVLRTLSPALRALERGLRIWLAADAVYPRSTLLQATLDGLANDLHRQAESLDMDRPLLVIMLMGGTGVGKSTLLNALAGGNIASGYGFTVTATGIGTRVVNVGASGAAFGVADNSSMTVMALLLATNGLTGANANGYSNVYDQNGDGVLDAVELALREQANAIYSAINGGGSM